MSGLNEVSLIGNLGRDPELRYTKKGTPVAQLNVATTRVYTDGDGNRVEDTEWHRVQVWGKQAENCDRYLSKGKQVFVRGRLKTSTYTDKEGVKRYSVEVVAQFVRFLGGGGGGKRPPHPADQVEPDDDQPDDLPPSPTDEDIPF